MDASSLLFSHWRAGVRASAVKIVPSPEQEVEKGLPGFPAKEIAIGVEHLRLFIERRKEEEKIVKPKEKVTHSIVSSVV